MATNPSETNLYKKFYSPRKSTRPSIESVTPVRPSAEMKTPPTGRRVKHTADKTKPFASPSQKELQESLKRKKAEKKGKRPMTPQMEKKLKKAEEAKVAQKKKSKGVEIKEPTEKR